MILPLFMELEKRALYNLLRMNWLNDPTIDVEPWQVEDYRTLPFDVIFRYLSSFDIDLDKASFLAYGDNAETPEELTALLAEDANLEAQEFDQVYLLVFELWRRLLPERMSLALFCDELDHQIYLYDNGNSNAAETIPDVISNLKMIMDENLDEGLKPYEIFQSVSASCAHDLESFLYDYIAEQIDNDNIGYASELCESFQEYLKGDKWFDLLSVRVLAYTDPEAADEALKKVVAKAAKDNDLVFNLELLSIIVQGGKEEDFVKIVKTSIPLIATEEDFQDLLYLCGDYYRCLDRDEEEQTIMAILDKRKEHPLDSSIAPQDLDALSLRKIVK